VAEAALATPEWEAVVKDAATFIDMAAHLDSWAEGHAIFWNPTP
jgi:hypothetical protein